MDTMRENQVTYATVHCDIGNSGSRTGVGAMMALEELHRDRGARHEGRSRRHPKALLEVCKEVHTTLPADENLEAAHERGTPFDMTGLIWAGTGCDGDAHATSPSFANKVESTTRVEMEVEAHCGRVCSGPHPLRNPKSV